jgi:hypothetical protein
MTISTTTLQADAEFIVKEEIPIAITLSSVSYTGTRQSVQQVRESANEGLRDRYSFSVYLIVSDLPATLPTVDSLATVSGVEYVIIGIHTDDVSQIIRFDLAEMYSGR